jgi:hypothetical protein
MTPPLRFGAFAPPIQGRPGHGGGDQQYDDERKARAQS